MLDNLQRVCTVKEASCVVGTEKDFYRRLCLGTTIGTFSELSGSKTFVFTGALGLERVLPGFQQF